MAIELVDTIVPMCAMLRRSLSSEAAASLITAFTRAASATGSLRPPSNQRVACSAPPRSFASSRMICEDTMSEPIAALAIVLAITIRARSSASGGRSLTFVLVRNRASSPAMLIASASRADSHLPPAVDRAQLDLPAWIAMPSSRRGARCGMLGPSLTLTAGGIMRALRFGIVAAMLGLVACASARPPGVRIPDVAVLAGTYTGTLMEDGMPQRPIRLVFLPDGSFEITASGEGGFRFNGRALADGNGNLLYTYDNDRNKGRGVVYEGGGRRSSLPHRE